MHSSAATDARLAALEAQVADLRKRLEANELRLVDEQGRLRASMTLAREGPMLAIRDETGIEPELSTSGGTSDGRFLIHLCPVVDFGLPNATMHKIGEHAAVEDIRTLSRIYGRVLDKVFG